MADIKTLLKEARKLIDEKNFNEAQECCKNILRNDKKNYFALVLLGKSLQDSEQVPLAYQKAISTKPDHPLAWQGLANYYERKNDDCLKLKLFSIYDEILKLQIEEDKVLEIIEKLGQLGCSLKNNEAISILIRYLNKEINSKFREAAERQLLELLNADISVKDNVIPLVLDIISKIWIKDPSDSLEVLQGKIILKKHDFASAVNEVMNLSFFPTNVLLRELLCKYLCKKFVQNDSFSNFAIENHIDKITEGIENSKYPNLLRSIICYKNKQYLEAYKKCVPLINYHEVDVTEATFIIRCTIMLKKWSITQKLASNFLLKAKNPTFAIELRKFLFLSLAHQQKWKQAILVTKDIPLQSLSISEQALLAECYIELNEPVDHLMKKLEATEYYTQLQSLLLLKQEKYNEVVTLLESAKENMLNLFYLGRAHWELKHYDKCLLNLLKAAKINPDHANTFLYLGHFYHYYKQDLEKAKKCYEKAYSLDNINTTITKCLSETLTKLNLKDADFELLNAAQKNIEGNVTWISFRLGLHYLNRRDWENAIINFRNVIKNEQNNTTAFECLADAYYSRGSFTSALRAYNKVMILDPGKKSHCLTRTGYIHNLLTQYDDAIRTFEKVFLIEPHSILALKGIAETWMRIAKKKETAKLYGSAKDCAQQAISYITKALSKQKQFLCLWKLLADALIFITKLPNKYCHVSVKDSFNDANQELIKKEKLDIFPQAIACYSFIAKQKQQLASCDLASAYLDYYHETKKIVNCNISFNLAITCIKEKPSSWRNWNILGKICLFVKKYDLAQHCFIKALLVTRKWCVAKIWCNLGTLYLKLKLFKLANYCFWRGQSTLPSYPQSWIGQGLIAEEIREEEAMDLFRHASRLGYHPESALGYADWVCRTLKNHNYKDDPDFKYVIDGLYAIPYAMDLMEWYLNFNPTDACACIIIGILQERSGLLRAALASYGKALQYTKDDSKKNVALLNIGRILVRLNKYEDAIKTFKAITEASLNSASGLALALFKRGLYEESYTAYDTALHWLSNDDDEKADLLVAMAGIVYMFKGADDAKTMLFHSIQISQKKPTAFSLFAICSLGLIHFDQSLYKLALSELQKYEKDSNYGFDIGFLRSYMSVNQDNVEEAIKLLSESLHDHPSNALLWYCMAQYCLRAPTTRAKVASCCAQRALCSARYDESNCEPSKMIATASIAEHIAGNHVKAMMLAKEGLHMYPCQAEIWAALLFSLLAHKSWSDKNEWIAHAASYMRRHLEISRPLSRWVGLLEKKLQK